MRSIDVRHEIVQMGGIRGKLRVLHLSDVHFSPAHSHKQNLQTAEAISDTVQAESPDIIALTGDLITRTANTQSFQAAETLAKQLCSIAPVLFSLGNHETDLTELQAFLEILRCAGVKILDNQTEMISGIAFTGLTLPGTVYKNEHDSYSDLTPVTKELVTECVGACSSHPCVLLAHSPMGFPAYAAWGADAVLSGHVHGGIVRVGTVGLLSPERRFFPEYTKGIYILPECVMNVSAGIGKLRLHNPAEVVCIDLLPVKEG